MVRPSRFGMAETGGVAAGFDVGEGLGHSVKAKGVKLIEGSKRATMRSRLIINRSELGLAAGRK
jgi:hypothetical protein